ncbi:MAG: MFS transporter [Desulfobacterales bacterium]|jgi:sugar phosphate permease
MSFFVSRRWIIFFLAAFLFVLSQFYRASVAVISPALMAELGFDARGLSLVSAAFFYAFAAMQIPIGLYLDSIGPRITMTVLTLVAVAGALLFALGHSLTALVAGRALLGIGMACNLMGTLKLITLWFGPLRFATLSALVVSVGTAGNIVAATPLVLMVDAVGWRGTFLVFAAVNLVLAVVFFLAVRDRPESPGKVLSASPAPAARKEALDGVRALFAEKDYWIISLGTFCRYGIYAAVQALWAGPFLMQVLGVSPVSAGNLLFLMSIGIVVGSPICGWLSDVVIGSRKWVVISGLLGMLAVLAVFSRIPVGVGFAPLAVLFFGFGVFSSAGQIMYAHIKERMPIERAGTAMTGINFFTMAGVAVFLQGLGRLMQRFYPEAALGAGAFRGAFLFCAGCLLVTAALYVMTKETLGRRSR